MFTAISYKTKQFLLVLIKIGLVVAAFYFVFKKLFDNDDLHVDEFIQNITNSSVISTNSLLILMLLSAFNWFFEILKWQTLVNRISKISLNEATAQSLGALTASLLTPNRIGDYGAKAMCFQPHLRKKILLLNLIGNSTRMAITLFFGSIGFTYLALRLQPEFNYKGLLIWCAVLAMSSVLFMSVLKMNRFKKQKKSFNNVRTFITETLTKAFFKIILLSLGRYLIFSFQFFYLLLLFRIEVNYFEAMAIISSMYLLTSIIPSIFIFDVVVKGGVAMYLFGLIEVPEAVIISIVTLLWILNFVIPSMIGSSHVLRFKLPKTVS